MTDSTETKVQRDRLAHFAHFAHFAQLRDQLAPGPLRDAMSSLIAHFRAGLDRDRTLVAQMATTIWASPDFRDGTDDAVRVARNILAEVDRG